MKYYIKKSPMPINTEYELAEKVMHELLHTKGIISFDSGINPEFIEWYQKMIEAGMA